MRTKTPIQYVIFSLFGVFSLPLVASADNITVVLDGYDYISPSINISYQTINQKISYPKITGCTRKNGQVIPSPTSATKFKTGDAVHIGLTSVIYNLSQNRFYLSSDVGDLICDGGSYSDKLFKHGFEDWIFFNGFEVVP